MKYYSGRRLKKEFEGYKIELISGAGIQDNNIYVPVNYNYYQNAIEVKKIHTYSGSELLNIWNDRASFNVSIIDSKIYNIISMNRTGWTKERYPIYYIELEEININ